MNASFASGQHDPSLLILSTIVAALSVYTAIDLSQRISQGGARHWLWLAMGAVAVGTGLWAAHFIGLQALVLTTTPGHDLTITTLSLLVATASAALMLYAASRERVSVAALAACAVLGGSGLSLVQYSGLQALRMQPDIAWNPTLLITATAAMMAICGGLLWTMLRLRDVQRGRRIRTWPLAALIAGLILSGAYALGLQAAHIAADSVSSATGRYDGVWAGIPLAVFTAVLTILTMVMAAHDTRMQTREAASQRQHDQEQRARILALYDGDTMMRNRASFQQEIVSLIQRSERSGRQFDLYYGALRFPGLEDDEMQQQAMRAIAERLKPLARQADLLARYSKNEFTLLRPRLFEADAPRNLREQLLAACTVPLQVGDAIVSPQAHVGSGHFPSEGTHSRQLLQAAARSPETPGNVPKRPILMSSGGQRVA